MSDLKEAINAYTKSEGITRDELAKRLGISRSTLFYRLNGSMWRIDEAMRLSKLLRLSLEDLVELAL